MQYCECDEKFSGCNDGDNREDRSSVKNVGSNTEISLEFKLDHASIDMRKREKRKNNVISHNLPESNAGSSEERKAANRVAVEKICGSVQVGAASNDAIKLGEKTTAKPRPVKRFLKVNRQNRNFCNPKLLDKTHITPY